MFDWNQVTRDTVPVKTTINMTARSESWIMNISTGVTQLVTELKENDVKLVTRSLVMQIFAAN